MEVLLSHETIIRRSGPADFAAGSGGQLVYVAPQRDLVVTIAAQARDDDNLALVNDVILAAEADAPAAKPCLARLGPD